MCEQKNRSNSIKTSSIRVASTSLHALFAGEEIKADDGSSIKGQICLPEYQRPYRWSEKQLEPLCQNLIDFIKTSSKNNECNDFFLGSIILHQGLNELGQLSSELNIIDGQQRLTSMALLGYLTKKTFDLPGLKFSSESENRIKANATWMATWMEENHNGLDKLDFQRLNITLVVTQSEDDAYQFFETQNTGGVRLNGTAIIKAQHLHAVPDINQDKFARQWESMANLDLLIEAVMKVRYWRKLQWRNLASRREALLVREEIVNELQGKKGETDVAYRNVRFCYDNRTWTQHHATDAYAIRQPLNTGINTINYFQYLYTLQDELFITKNDTKLENFYKIYKILLLDSKPSDYIRKLFDAALLLYASQFGTEKLLEAALWLFRVITSPRLTNERTVKESTVQKFVRDEFPVFDLIVASYSHDELIDCLRAFKYKIDGSNLKEKTKKRFFIIHIYSLLMPASPHADAEELIKFYDQALVRAIENNFCIALSRINDSYGQ